MDIDTDTVVLPRALLLSDYVRKAQGDLMVDEVIRGVAHSREGGGTGLNPEWVEWVKRHG